METQIIALMQKSSIPSHLQPAILSIATNEPGITAYPKIRSTIEFIQNERSSLRMEQLTEEQILHNLKKTAEIFIHLYENS